MTINQACRNKRKNKKNKKKSPLGFNAQKSGVCIKVSTQSPKKPNSANRKVVRVKLSNGLEITSYIPGEVHNLQEHSTVLVRNKRKKDLPGVNTEVIRGVKDLGAVVGRTVGGKTWSAKRARSKKGVKKPS